MQICICKYIFLALLALCRVSLQRHSANIHSLPCAWARAHGKEVFHVALRLPTLFCRVWSIAHGKIIAVCPRFSSRQSCSLPAVVCRARFAVRYTRQILCRVSWHTANSLCPVVDDITNSIQEKDFSDVKPAEELLENPAFQFLQD